MKNRKISQRIAILVGIVEIVAMAALFIITNHNVTKVLETKAFKDMDVMAKDRAQLVETYIRGYCDYIDGYSKSREIIEVLKHPDDPEYIQRSRDYTDLYASGHDYMEGLYVAQWDTYVLAHINPDSVDKTFRDGDSAKALENLIKATGKPFCTGIVMAPVTKKMVIPIYAPVYNENGEAIGFVGAAFLTEGLEHQFSTVADDESAAQVGYSLINAETKVYIFDNDEKLVGAECTDENILGAIKTFKNGDEDNYCSYSSADRVASCFYMADRDWVFVVTDTGTDAFRTLNNVRTGLIASCLVITVIMVIMCIMSVNAQISPLNAINEAIIRLQENDFSKDSLIEEYLKRDDEFGTIAKAVTDLHGIMENQYELFLEMLKAQTVGMLVVNSETNQITLINSMAMKQFGFKEGDEAKIKLEDIYAKISLDQLEEVKKKIEFIKKDNTQTTFEITIEADDRLKYLLVYANGVTLSNGNRVRIFSQVDITERKELENDLLILSETDSLTGICNRRSGECRIENAMKEGTMGMFCLFDVNKFKYVNDTFGHAVGDQVLIGIAETMKKTFRTSDVLIRLGGDEFVVYAANVKTEDIGRLVIDRFLNNLEAFGLEELDGHKITVSLGAVMVSDRERFGDMYTKADSLMYECKHKGGNAYVFYEEEEEG